MFTCGYFAGRFTETKWVICSTPHTWCMFFGGCGGDQVLASWSLLAWKNMSCFFWRFSLGKQHHALATAFPRCWPRATKKNTERIGEEQTVHVRTRVGYQRHAEFGRDSLGELHQVHVHPRRRLGWFQAIWLRGRRECSTKSNYKSNMCTNLHVIPCKLVETQISAGK